MHLCEQQRSAMIVSFCFWSRSRTRAGPEHPKTGTLAVVHSAGDEAPGPREEQEGFCANGKGSCSSQVCECRIGISCLDMHLCALWIPAPLKSSELKFYTHHATIMSKV
jgi:hypothetical protein